MDEASSMTGPIAGAVVGAMSVLALIAGYLLRKGKGRGRATPDTPEPVRDAVEAAEHERAEDRRTERAEEATTVVLDNQADEDDRAGANAAWLRRKREGR